MTKITVFKKDYVTELVKIIRNAKNAQVLQKHLANAACWGYTDREILQKNGAEVLLEKPLDLLELLA